MVCAPHAPANAPPNSTVFLEGDPGTPSSPPCLYRIEWHTPYACKVGTPIPPPAPTPPPPPPPFPSCIFVLQHQHQQPYTINLTGLPMHQFLLHDDPVDGDGYHVVSPCKYVDNTLSPATEATVPSLPGIPTIPLGYATALTVQPLPPSVGAEGLRLILGGGDPRYCGTTQRQVWYVCDIHDSSASRFVNSSRTLFVVLKLILSKGCRCTTISVLAQFASKLPHSC